MYLKENPLIAKVSNQKKIRFSNNFMAVVINIDWTKTPVSLPLDGGGLGWGE